MNGPAPTQPPLVPTVQTIDDRGVMLLEIADHEGKVISYILERDWVRPGVALLVRRIDGEAGPYLVWRRPGRLWTCDCPAFKYRSGALGLMHLCKHVVCAKAIFQQAVRLTTRPEDGQPK